MFNPLPATTIGALEQTLQFTERRHELLAGNIANLSTPDYRSRDLDVSEFQASLAKSIREGQQPSSSHEGHPHRMMIPGIPPHLLGHPMMSHDAQLPEGIGETNSPAKSGQAMTRDDQFSGPRAAMESVVYHDNSDVSLENQVTEIAKNKHMHDLAITTMRSQFDLLRAAITERA